MENLQDPSKNKGSAFTQEERNALKVDGMIPNQLETQEMQLKRVRNQFDTFDVPLNKYTFLAMLQMTNSRLFYKFLLENLVDCLPIVYTPTVGEACVEYSHIFRKPQGMYFSGTTDKGRVRTLLDHWPSTPDIIVVTDGGRILGLGDLGLNGMGIPIGKLSLYVAGAGFDPERTLPVMLDMGTDNEALLKDEYYLGDKHHRLPEPQYLSFVEEFLMGVKEKWPKCIVQFEDFATPHAIKLLSMYRKRLLCFNDDIQGTGSVILAGFLNAVKAQGTDPKEVRCVFYGAGSAAIGIAEIIVAMLETMGLTNEEARRRFWLIDSKGLIVQNRGDTLAEHKVPFARPDAHIRDLLSVIKEVKPHVLMGLAGSGPAFHKEHVDAMQAHCEHPILFPLSNPTSKAEVSAIDAYTWTNGKCIFAAGSPFAPVELNGRTYFPAQGNNMFIFPGVGLGAHLCGATEVTDLMFINAAKSLAAMVTPEQLSQGTIYPSLTRLREVSAKVAASTMETAYEQGLATDPRPEGDLVAYCAKSMWDPTY